MAMIQTTSTPKTSSSNLSSDLKPDAVKCIANKKVIANKTIVINSMCINLANKKRAVISNRPYQKSNSKKQMENRFVRIIII